MRGWAFKDLNEHQVPGARGKGDRVPEVDGDEAGRQVTRVQQAGDPGPFCLDQ